MMFRSAAVTLIFSLTTIPSFAFAAALDVTSASNGLTEIYSTTFDGGLTACGGGSSTYCTFFGGDPGATRTVFVTPTPSGLVGGVPGGIGPTASPAAPVPAAGSFLDLTLSGGNTLLTLGVSSITFAPFNLCVNALAISCYGINASAANAGMVFNPTGPALGGVLTPAGGGSTGNTVAVDGSGKAVFEIQQFGTIVGDFSRMNDVVTHCDGAYCALVSANIVTFDILRYVLEIQYDPTFTSFTGKFIGQTPNNSLVYATLNAVPVPPAVWLLGSALGLMGMMRRKVSS